MWLQESSFLCEFEVLRRGRIGINNYVDLKMTGLSIEPRSSQ